MNNICLYFQVHQPMRLKRYRFFNLGNDHYYYDDYLNESVFNRVALNSYLPVNQILLKIIKEYGCRFKICFSISGLALEQCKLYEPEVLESFQELAKTGCVEFLAETYSHSLVALRDNDEFEKQVNEHAGLIHNLFGQKPTAFRGTELIYSDDIGKLVYEMGYSTVLTEGAKHVLGWKSPNYLYCNSIEPKQKVLLRNFELSDDLSFRFANKDWAEYPLTAKKYVDWIGDSLGYGETVNLFMDYETFGEHQAKESGIMEFLEEFPKEVFTSTNFEFSLPSELSEKLQPISAVHVPIPISWADEERDLTAWLGNEMQQNAFEKLYALSDKIKQCKNEELLANWKYLQASDHFYYMSTKVLSDGEVHAYFNPFDSPYDAYVNYMNILSDFSIQLNVEVPENKQEHELAILAAIIYEKNQQIEKYEEEIKQLKQRIKKKRTKIKASGKTKTRKVSNTTTKASTGTGQNAKDGSTKNLRAVKSA